MPNKRQRKKNSKKFGTGNTIYQFRVGKKTLEEYQKERRNTLSKISRIKREHRVDVSDQVRLPNLEEFSSRKEFKDWVKEVQWFRSRSNEDFQFIKNERGFSASKKRVKELEKKAHENREKAIEEYERTYNLPYEGGEKGQTVGMVNPTNLGVEIPNEFDFDQIQNEYVMKEFEERINERQNPHYYDERQERMMENFKVILEGSYNGLADELIEKLNQISANAFWNIYKMNFNDFDFELYDTEGQQVMADESYIGRMLGHIERHLEGQTNTDLWHSNFD